MMPLHWVAAITLPFLRNVEGTVMKGLKRRGWESVTWASRKFCLLSWEPLQKKKKKNQSLFTIRRSQGTWGTEDKPWFAILTLVYPPAEFLK